MFVNCKQIKSFEIHKTCHEELKKIWDLPVFCLFPVFAAIVKQPDEKLVNPICVCYVQNYSN